jgi:multidrug efflux pump subunit AcrB
VDNSIVVLENIERHLEKGKTPREAAETGTREVAIPVLVSTLVIMVVFFPIFFLVGMAQYLFSPLAVTVACSMAGSYIFSMTLIPICAMWLYKQREPTEDQSSTEEQEKKSYRLLVPFQRGVLNLRERYQSLLPTVLLHRLKIIGATGVLFLVTLFMGTRLGYELFPEMDVGQMQIQARLEPGTPLRETEEHIKKMENIVRETTGDDLKQLVSNIGVFYDLPAAYTPNAGTQDAFMKVQLKPGHETSTFKYARQLRKKFHEQFPGVDVSFNTGGMVRTALNEGSPVPVDVQVKGDDFEVLDRLTRSIRDTLRDIKATRDVRIKQRLDQPHKEIDIDREKANKMGITGVDAIKNLVSGMNASSTYDKTFWVAPNGNHYFVGVTYRENQIHKDHTIGNIPLTSKKHDRAVQLKQIADIKRFTKPASITHHTLIRVLLVYANV